MFVRINVLEVLVCLLLLAPTGVLASSCESKSLPGQRPDAATILRLEAAWSTAISQGDSGFERCLLASDFTIVVSSGAVKTLDDELTSTSKNKGRNEPLPLPPSMSILIHGNVAVARGLFERSEELGVGSEFTRPWVCVCGGGVGI